MPCPCTSKKQAAVQMGDEKRRRQESITYAAYLKPGAMGIKELAWSDSAKK